MKTKLHWPHVVGLVALIVGLSGCAGDHYDRSTGEYIDDKAISQRVEDALDDDPVYKFQDVEVATFKGKVQLSGFVTSQEQKRRAEEMVENVVGVTEVANNIIVKD